MRGIRTGTPAVMAGIAAVARRTRIAPTSECLASGSTESRNGAARRIARTNVESAIPRTVPITPPRIPESGEVLTPCTRRTITPTKMYRASQITVNDRNPPQGVGILNAACNPGTGPVYRAPAATNAATIATRSITAAEIPYRVPRRIDTRTIASVVQSIQFTAMVRPILSARLRRPLLAEPDAGQLLEGYSNLPDDFLRFLRGERPVRRAQPQPVREVSMRIGYRRSGVHVE